MADKEDTTNTTSVGLSSIWRPPIIGLRPQRDSKSCPFNPNSPIDMATNNPPEIDIKTTRIFLSTFLQVYDYKSQQASLEKFLREIPRLQALQPPTDEADQFCMICRENLWPLNNSEPSESRLQLPCCSKMIGEVCLKLWLSSKHDGKEDLSIFCLSQQC